MLKCHNGKSVIVRLGEQDDTCAAPGQKYHICKGYNSSKTSLPAACSPTARSHTHGRCHRFVIEFTVEPMKSGISQTVLY